MPWSSGKESKYSYIFYIYMKSLAWCSLVFEMWSSDNFE